MNFSILDDLEDKYTEYVFGYGKTGSVFVNGQPTTVIVDGNSTFESVEKDLLKGKFIKK